MEIAAAYVRFGQSLLRYIRSKIRSEDDAKDILHNVFAKISGNVHALEGKKNIANWLFVITRNAIIDHYRNDGSRKQLLTDETAASHVMEEDSVDTTQGLDHCIHSMIGLLPDDYRSIVIDSELNGIRQKELAIKYNMPYSSLRSRVQRGREKLKRLLQDCCSIETDRHGNVLESIPKKECDNPCEGSC